MQAMTNMKKTLAAQLRTRDLKTLAILVIAVTVGALIVTLSILTGGQG